MSGKVIAIKSLKEKWLIIVQSAEEKGEKGIGGSSIVTISTFDRWVKGIDDHTVAIRYDLVFCGLLLEGIDDATYKVDFKTFVDI